MLGKRRTETGKELVRLKNIMVEGERCRVMGKNMGWWLNTREK